jgi:alpha/beta superfamily hydrolase
MNIHTRRFQVQGPAGTIEMLRDQPGDGVQVKGTAVIAHPHPLFAGTMDNKVVQTVARAFVQSGWIALRFNFRGVGASEGLHDDGRGETDDLLSIIASQAAEGPLALAGFSFGSYVALRAIESLGNDRQPDKIILVGTAASRFVVPPLAKELRDRTLVLHGELDDTVPLESVIEWARPQSLPVTVVPGVEHFFHGQLPLLKSLVMRHLRS